MTSYLIDINVWLAMTWGSHIHHNSAARWEQTKPASVFLFCRFTMLGFLRLLTTRQVIADGNLSVNEALVLYDAWLSDSRVEFRREPRGIGKSLRMSLEHIRAQQAPKAVADCYLAAFAESSGARLVTFDRALAQLGERRNVHVELLRPE